MRDAELASGDEREPNDWDSRIGPFHDGPGLARRLAVTLDQLDGMVLRGDILCTPSSDGTALYPTFQFGPGDALLPGLSHVLAVLDPKMLDPWGDALWLRAPTTRFDGLTAAEVMRQPDLDLTLTAARQDRATWDL